MISGKNKKYFVAILIIFCLVIISPVVLISYYLSHQEISTNVADWGSLGDYIGGSTNTLISFISLIVLGYLTYLVSKQSNEENKRINILMRKLEAYDDLTKYLPLIFQIISESITPITIINESLIENQSFDDKNYIERKNEIIKNFKLLHEFHHFLNNFNVRYSHLFDYDFNSSEYKALLDHSSEFQSYVSSIINTFELNEHKAVEIPDFKMFFEKLTILVNALRNEIKK